MLLNVSPNFYGAQPHKVGAFPFVSTYFFVCPKAAFSAMWAIVEKHEDGKKSKKCISGPLKFGFRYVHVVSLHQQ